jgi:deoxyadenosine/deoxycytidine kinase
MKTADSNDLPASAPAPAAAYTARGGYTVVEGPVGVGKTSLAQRLADAYACELLLERPQENPFLERFYQSRRNYALPTQLFFLFQRARQLSALKQGDMFRPGCVSDFMLEKDSLFARLLLDDDELRLYEQVYANLSPEVPTPDLVVYLQAPVPVIQDRIRRRGIGYELSIDDDYLEQLVHAYTNFFHSYTAAPLLIINAAEINFVDSDEDFQMLLEYINGVTSGRHFFNPLSTQL